MTPLIAALLAIGGDYWESPDGQMKRVYFSILRNAKFYYDLTNLTFWYKPIIKPDNFSNLNQSDDRAISNFLNKWGIKVIPNKWGIKVIPKIAL